MPSIRSGLRWMFLALGLLMCMAPGLVVDHVLDAFSQVARLYPNSAAGQMRFAAIRALGVMSVGFVCLLTSWGLKMGWGWAIWTGRLASLLLLLGFPWLTPAGAIGFYFLFAAPPPPLQKNIDDSGDAEFWSRKHKSPFRWFPSVIWGAMYMAGWIWARSYNQRTLGMPDPDRAADFWAILFFGRIICVTVHELGHALVAQAVGFRFKQINVGPLTIAKDQHGYRHFRFEWKRLLSQTGYAASVPTSESGVRADAILVVVAGPFASLIGGLLLWLTLMRLPGTAWERTWPMVASFSLSFLADFIANLIPIGYTDGTMLWHLILWTRHGQNLYSHFLDAKNDDDAVEKLAGFDFEGDLKLRERALQAALARGDKSSAALGLCYQALGFAQLRLAHWEEAEVNLRKSLDILAPRGDVDPLLAANSWMGLSKARRILQNVTEAMRAYESAVAGFESRKKICATRVDLVTMRSALAKLHADFENFPAALREIDSALEELPNGAQHLLQRAGLYRTRMECEIRLGSPEKGFQAAEEAATILRSAEIPETQRNQAIAAIGYLGVAFWMAGRVSEALALLEESARGLDERSLAEKATDMRLAMINVLRKAGRLSEAEAALPDGTKLGMTDRRRLLDERAEIHLAAGRSEEAVADFEAVVRLATEHPPLGPLKSAIAQVSLARAYLQANRLEEAEALARTSSDTFRAMRNPELAESLVTLSIIDWRRQDTTCYWPEALRVVVDAPLLEPASKARFLERTAGRLERAGRIDEAAQARAAASEQWSALGAVQVG